MQFNPYSFFFIQCTEYYENTIENNHISYLYQGQFHHFFTEKNGTSYLLKDKKENQSIEVQRILNIWKPLFERCSFDLCAIIEVCEICVSFIVKTWNLGIVSSNLTLCYITIYGQLPVSIWFNVLRSENAIRYINCRNIWNILKSNVLVMQILTITIFHFTLHWKGDWKIGLTLCVQHCEVR